MIRLRSLALAALLPAVAGCGGEDDAAELDRIEALVGTWEVTGETGQLNRNGLRYTFDADSTLRTTRPRPLGPASTTLATFDFSGDTLVIRGPFDAELFLPDVGPDTLVLTPLGSGDPMTLVRVEETAAAPPPRPSVPPPVPAAGDTVDFPPPTDPAEQPPSP